jgi:ubiquitin carboxyl-terminal hydrolase 22/27/51
MFIEHIARLITEGRVSAADFGNLLSQTVSNSTLKIGGRPADKLDKPPSAALSNHYHCIQCPETGSSADINKHAKTVGHGFALELRSWTLYCANCRDLVYDPTMESIKRGKAAASPNRSAKRKFFDVDEDDTFWAENSSQQKCGQEGVRGLFNLGETCYMNSILQMMVHNQLLSSYFLGNGHPAHTCSVAAKMDMRANGSLDDEDEDDEGITKAEYQPCVGCGVSEVFAESRKWEMAKPMEAVNLLFASWKAIPVSYACAMGVHTHANNSGSIWQERASKMRKNIT